MQPLVNVSHFPKTNVDDSPYSQYLQLQLSPNIHIPRSITQGVPTHPYQHTHLCATHPLNFCFFLLTQHSISCITGFKSQLYVCEHMLIRFPCCVCTCHSSTQNKPRSLDSFQVSIVHIFMRTFKLLN